MTGEDLCLFLRDAILDLETLDLKLVGSIENVKPRLRNRNILVPL